MTFDLYLLNQQRYVIIHPISPPIDGGVDLSERCDAAHLVRQLVLVATRPDWFLVTVECGGVCRRVAEETVTPRPQQVVGGRLHLVHCHVTCIGNLPLCKRHKLRIPRVQTETLRDQDLKGAESGISEYSQVIGH